MCLDIYTCNLISLNTLPCITLVIAQNKFNVLMKIYFFLWLFLQTLGRHLVMFNCSEQLTTAMFVRYLFGMVTSGSWACFENVDCVGPGILSIFGEHVSNIRTSLKCLEKFVFSQYTARGLSKTDNPKVCYYHFAAIK